MDRLRQLIHEIHRRSLWQVLGIYVVASWAVLQVVDTVAGALRLPEWTEPFALVLLIVGLPIVLATAFVQEGISGRQESSRPVKASASAPVSGVFTWRNALGGGVLAFALWGVVAAGWVLFGGSAGAGGSVAVGASSLDPSIAVLPFDDLSPAEDQRYFVEGLSEEIINALSQIADLKVAARTSAFAFQDTGLGVRTIADSLGVANVLEGSVRRDGDRLRITAQLIEAETGFNLWSDSFDRELTDVFAIQDEIARAITDRLRISLSQEQQSQLVEAATSNVEAHDAYLRGRYLWNQRSEQSLRNALSEFRRAIDLDPGYTQAWSGLADSHLLVDAYTMNLGNLAYRTNFEGGLDAARTAVSLAPRLGEAHASLAWGLFLTGAWDSAEREFERAIALNPGYATAHHWYGYFLFSTGRALEGISHAERAAALDPISRVISRDAAAALWVAGQREAATARFRYSVDLSPAWANGWSYMSWALLATEAYEEGRDAWDNYLEWVGVDDPPDSDVYEATIRHRETGEPQSFDDFDSNRHTLIWVYAQTGQTDRLLDAFAGFVEPGAYGWAAHVDALWVRDALADDPRYRTLLEQAGITW